MPVRQLVWSEVYPEQRNPFSPLTRCPIRRLQGRVGPAPNRFWLQILGVTDPRIVLAYEPLAPKRGCVRIGQPPFDIAGEQNVSIRRQFPSVVDRDDEVRRPKNRVNNGLSQRWSAAEYGGLTD